MLKFLTLAAIIFLSSLFPEEAFAKGEFLQSYDVTYDVSLNGETKVSEKITIKNQTDRLYAASLTIPVHSTQVYNVEAYDNIQALPVETKKEDQQTLITIKPAQQVAGKGKEYSITLTFSSKDFASKQGKVWQVFVPKITSLEDLSAYNLTLSIPLELGDPASISTEPERQTESFGKVNYYFSEKKIAESGIIAIFGQEQNIRFKLTYSLKNKSFLPRTMAVPLPPDTEYQEVFIESINPKPENVIIDEEGNYTGMFKLDRRESAAITIEGYAKLLLGKKNLGQGLTDMEKQKYLRADKYWEKDSHQIKEELNKIFSNRDMASKTNYEKSKLINKQIITNLLYSVERAKIGNAERLGASTAVSNPRDSLSYEFSDLFLALSKGAGIPARQVIGLAISSNRDLRPMDINGGVLHSWAEFYDPVLGWLMVDPTWQSTTGGVDYFSKNDLSRLVISRNGYLSAGPLNLPKIEADFLGSIPEPVKGTSLSVIMADEILAGFPQKAGVRIENTGNKILPPQKIVLSSSKIIISARNPTQTDQIPPYGNFTKEFDLRSEELWSSYYDIIQLRVGDSVLDREIVVKPFFSHKYFSFGVLGILGGMGLLYGLTLFLHIKAFKRSK